MGGVCETNVILTGISGLENWRILEILIMNLTDRATNVFSEECGESFAIIDLEQVVSVFGFIYVIS